MTPQPSVALPFSVTVNLTVYRTDHRKRLRKYTALVTNLVYEPSLWPDDPFTPAFVFGEWIEPGTDLVSEVAVVVPSQHPVKDLTPEYLAAREWSAEQYSRFNDTDLGIGLGYRQALPVAQALEILDLPVSRSIIHDLQQRRQEAVKQFDQSWVNGEYARMLLEQGKTRPLPLAQIADSLVTYVAIAEGVEQVANDLAEAALTMTQANAGTHLEAQANWIAQLCQDAKKLVETMNRPLRRYRGHAEFAIAHPVQPPAE